jgi:hypothetical protein
MLMPKLVVGFLGVEDALDAVVASGSSKGIAEIAFGLVNGLGKVFLIRVFVGHLGFPSYRSVSRMLRLVEDYTTN